MVLIISNTCDPTADIVVRELRHRKAPFIRLNTDEYPVYVRGTFSLERGDAKSIISWNNRDQELNLNSIKSIWYRRPVPPKAPETLDPELRKFVTAECYDFLRGLWYSLECLWVSHPDSIRRAEHKTYQLAVAARLGFPIPRTLISNDPTLIRQFEESCAHGMIAKAVYMGFMDNPPRNIFTTVVGATDLQDDESLRVSPVIFQERVKKSCDIRVTVIGNEVFATEIRTTLPDSIPDWRAADPKTLTHCRHTLPSVVENRCRQLVNELGLHFGAIDMAIDHHGEYAFFEINPNGQWAWLEPTTGYPLTKSLVDLLEGIGHVCPKHTS